MAFRGSLSGKSNIGKIGYCPRCRKEVKFDENNCENGHHIFDGDEDKYEFCRFCRDYTLRGDGSCINGHVLFNPLESIYLKLRKKRLLKHIASLMENWFAFLVILSLFVGIYFWTLTMDSSSVFVEDHEMASLIIIIVVTLLLAYFVWMVIKLNHLWMTRRNDPKNCIKHYALEEKEGYRVMAVSTRQYPFEKDNDKLDSIVTSFLDKSRYSIFLFMAILVTLSILLVWLPHRDRIVQQQNMISEALNEQERYAAIPYEIEETVGLVRSDIDTLKMHTNEIDELNIGIMEIAWNLREIRMNRDVEIGAFYFQNDVDYHFDVIRNQMLLSLTDGIYSYFLDDAKTVKQFSERAFEIESTCDAIIDEIEVSCGKVYALCEEREEVVAVEGSGNPRRDIIGNIKKIESYVGIAKNDMPSYAYRHWDVVEAFYDEWIALLSTANPTTTQVEDIYNRFMQIYSDWYYLIVRNKAEEDYYNSMPYNQPSGQEIYEEDLDSIFTEIDDAIKIFKESSD